MVLMLLPVLCHSNSNRPSREGSLNAHHMMSILDEVELVKMNQDSRRLNINECLDATDYFDWDTTNAGENLLRLYYNCSCSGDFGSAFSMHCVLENHCFGGGDHINRGNDGDDSNVSLAQDTNITEQCVTRSFTYDFLVDTETRELLDIPRFVASDVFESGFGFSGNFTGVNYNPCRIRLQQEYGYGREDALSICNNRTTCEAFFKDNPTLRADEIDYICPIVMVDGVECNAFNLVECADFDNETQTRYIAMPDCSNVDPCLTSSCQAYPRVDTSPERFLFRYPKCDATTPTLAPSASVPTDACSSAFTYLGTSFNLEEYYDCECSSSDSDTLVMKCQIEDYCFLDKKAASLEYCVNHNLTFTYSVDATTNELSITRAESCTDFLQNGPEGRLCRNDWNICRLKMFDVLLDLDNATAICLDRDACIVSVQSLLNYTQAEAEYLCPTVTLNGQECNTVGFDECGEQDFDNNLFFRNMPDCSNVESCAKSTCQTGQVRDPTPQRFMETFPQCGLAGFGGDGDDTPTENPTKSPGNLSPGDTIRASGASRSGFDYSLSGSILLGTILMTCLSNSRW